jgi:hypothetical protein
VGSILAQGVAVERAHDSLSGTKDSLSFQKGSNLGAGDILSEERFTCDLGSQPRDTNDWELMNLGANSEESQSISNNVHDSGGYCFGGRKGALI